MKAGGSNLLKKSDKRKQKKSYQSTNLFKYQENKHRNDMIFFHFLGVHFIIKICENFYENLLLGSRLNKTV